jgi:integrase
MIHQRVEGDFHDAELAQDHKERELLAASQGFVLSPEETELNDKKSHRVVDTIESYLADLEESRRSAGAIKVKRAELTWFRLFCKKTNVEELTRRDLIAYRNHLMDRKKKNKTTINKLRIVSTWLAWLNDNEVEVVPVKAKLKDKSMKKGGDWPDDPFNPPHPYSKAEKAALLEHAGEHRLFIWFALATGMRRQEIAHAEIEDIVGKNIKVQAKPKWGWSPKSDAGTRDIPLGDKLLAALKASRKSGLLFPNGAGNPSTELIHIIQDIAKLAGVPKAILHRCRDTYATEMVQSRKLDLREVARRLGHSSLNHMRLYADYVDLNSKASRQR